MSADLYNKEYHMYMEYALQRYLIEKGYLEEEAKRKVLQDFDEVEQAATADKYI